MKKIHAVRLRVNDEEFTQLHKSAKELGVTTSALLRLHMNNGLKGNCASAARMETRLEHLEHNLSEINQQLRALQRGRRLVTQPCSRANTDKL